MAKKKPKKILIVVSNRANYGRLKPVMAAIRDHPSLELLTLVTGAMLVERYGRAIDVVREDGFRVDGEIFHLVEGNSPAVMPQSLALAIPGLVTHFQHLTPDIVLVNADRYETLGVSIAASLMNLPVAHIQGGEVSGTIDESIRHANTKLSHLHFVATERSKIRVIQMGEHPDFVFLTGCPTVDLIAHSDLSIEAFKAMHLSGVGHIDRSKPYLLISHHPVTTEAHSAEAQIKLILRAVSRLGLQTVILWPNPDAGTEMISKAIRHYRENRANLEGALFLKNLPPEQYYCLMAHASCLVGNSSSFLREAGMIGVPAVIVGNRQSRREMCINCQIVDNDETEILGAIQQQLAVVRYPPDLRFGSTGASSRIAEILSNVNPPIQKYFHDF